MRKEEQKVQTRQADDLRRQINDKSSKVNTDFTVARDLHNQQINKIIADRSAAETQER